MVVLCPQSPLAFGDPTTVAEFVREGVHWLELIPPLNDASTPALLQAFTLLLQNEARLTASSAAIRARVAGTAQEGPSVIRNMVTSV